ncbi:hypothetical protein HDU98_010322 [Podochytrium sp. JEL0797]|nr:hypothetical protein HDU98_010322 [Podochytrium sp. JEL0797]
MCPSKILLPNPNFNASNPTAVLPIIDGQQCTGACCFACPMFGNFYQEKEVADVTTTTYWLNAISLVLALFTFSSLFLIPWQYPGYMLFHLFAAVIAAHLSFLMAPAYEKSTCLDPITQATQTNSPLCFIEGFIFFAATFYAMCWGFVFSISLNFLIVSGNPIFEGKFVYLIGVIGGLCIAIPASLAAYGDIGVTFFGCGFGANAVLTNNVYLYHMTSLAVPTCLFSLHSVYYILKVQFESLEKRKSSVEGRKNAAVAAAVVATKQRRASTTAATATLDAYHAKLKKIVQETGRSVGFGVLQVLDIAIVLTIVNTQMGVKMANVPPATPWVQEWYLCAMSGKGRSECARVVEGQLPDIVYWYAAYGGYGTMGILVFAVFGPRAVRLWWAVIFSSSEGMKNQVFQ